MQNLRNVNHRFNFGSIWICLYCVCVCVFFFFCSFCKSIICLLHFPVIIQADWSEQFVFNVHARSISPCDPHTGIGVLFEYPACILDRADRIRLFGKLRADVASLAPPTSLHYITEQVTITVVCTPTNDFSFFYFLMIFFFQLFFFSGVLFPCLLHQSECNGYTASSSRSACIAL